MSGAYEIALTPASLATDGEQGEGANAVCAGEAEHTPWRRAALSDVLAMLGTAAEFLGANARATDEPRPGIVEAADLIDTARAMLAQAVAP